MGRFGCALVQAAIESLLVLIFGSNGSVEVLRASSSDDVRMTTLGFPLRLGCARLRLFFEGLGLMPSLAQHQVGDLPLFVLEELNFRFHNLWEKQGL